MDLLEQIQRRAMKVVRGLKHLSSEDRLSELSSLNLKKASRRPYSRLSILKGVDV